MTTRIENDKSDLFSSRLNLYRGRPSMFIIIHKSKLCALHSVPTKVYTTVLNSYAVVDFQ